MALEYPFLADAFINALHSSGSVNAQTGWQPLSFNWDSGVMPLYLKSHSRGEYVFDYAWAEAYQRYGRQWYPKLVSAIPYSPVVGPRLLGEVLDQQVFWEALMEKVSMHGASSWHLLFANDVTRQQLDQLPLIERHGCHFCWFNRDYEDWSAFLEQLTSRKRKMIRKERAQIPAQGLTVRRLVGKEISEPLWQQFYRCYCDTYLKRGQHPYLNSAFFDGLATSDLAEQVLMVVAEDELEQVVAMALYLFDDDALYGRYWGGIRDYHCLHFELCYYQGIEFAIEKGFKRFDPGVQGEHKILRGFEPIITTSLHWLKEQAFHQAVADFCQQEKVAVDRYKAEATELLPYKKTMD